MTNISHAQKGYGANAAAARTPRETEHEIFRKTTILLKAASAEKASFSEVADAIRKNRQLWGVIAADVAESANALPDVLKAQILSLAAFVNSHSRLVLKGVADIDPLIEVNLSVMRGLKSDLRGAA